MNKRGCLLLLASLSLWGMGCEDAGGAKESDAGTEDSGMAAADPSTLLVTITSGKVQGVRVGSVREFLGIPYAKPPVGALRFMPPEPVEPWTDTFDATEFGPACIQPARVIAPPGPKSEDCLSLNIFAPDAEAEPRPVMVWIHGGGFTGGGSSQYNGARLASERGVIVVTLNYRLGPLGFFAHPALDAERGDVPSGNDGLHDQQLALRWVQDNIAAFGGDPTRVTVFGESAGGFSTCMHFVSPTARDLAQRFIVQSGSCVATAGISSQEKSRALSAEFAGAFCEEAEDPLECLREKDADELASWAMDRTVLGAGWTPAFGGNDPILPAAPLTLITQGSQHEGELIVGTNKDEWGFFVRFAGPNLTSVSEFEAAIGAELTAYPDVVAQVVEHYAPTDETAQQTYIRVLSDVLFRCPARTLARAATAQGNRVYLYSFEQGLAYHAYELPYVFGNPNALLEAPQVDPLHGLIAAYWTRFAQEGDPNVDGQTSWPVYDAASDQHLRLTDTPEKSSGLAREDCDFWDALTKT